MSRYSVMRRETRKKEPTHAVWRGIGCLLMLLVPLMSWILAAGTLQAALKAGWPLPYQLLGYPVLPAQLWGIQALWPVLSLISRQQHLYMQLVFTVVFIIFIAAVLSFIYALIYRFVGPPQYGPLDAPQPQIKVGRFKR